MLLDIIFGLEAARWIEWMVTRLSGTADKQYLIPLIPCSPNEKNLNKPQWQRMRTREQRWLAADNGGAIGGLTCPGSWNSLDDDNQYIRVS